MNSAKVANLRLPHLHLTYPICIWCLRWVWLRLSFAEIIGIGKLESLGRLGYRVALFAWSYVYRFSRTPTCNRQTDRQTDTRLRHIYSASMAPRRRAVKTTSFSNARVSLNTTGTAIVKFLEHHPDKSFWQQSSSAHDSLPFAWSAVRSFEAWTSFDRQDCPVSAAMLLQCSALTPPPVKQRCCPLLNDLASHWTWKNGVQNVTCHYRILKTCGRHSGKEDETLLDCRPTTLAVQGVLKLTTLASQGRLLEDGKIFLWMHFYSININKSISLSFRRQLEIHDRLSTILTFW